MLTGGGHVASRLNGYGIGIGFAAPDPSGLDEALCLSLVSDAEETKSLISVPGIVIGMPATAAIPAVLTKIFFATSRFHC